MLKIHKERKGPQPPICAITKEDQGNHSSVAGNVSLK